MSSSSTAKYERSRIMHAEAIIEVEFSNAYECRTGAPVSIGEVMEEDPLRVRATLFDDKISARQPVGRII